MQHQQLTHCKQLIDEGNLQRHLAAPLTVITSIKAIKAF